MRTLKCCLVVILTLAASVTFAAEIDDEAVDKAVLKHNAQAAEPDKVVCKRVRQTGSHFKRRICQKQRQWDRLTEEAHRDMRNFNEQQDIVGTSG